ncbi:hypothetical protein B0H63DRAFT_518884 [Podospora didyma]|uniref:Uncharacterized protein n=1 Tax=Podospora didyma TaxID=330526 RepID=A0AAE0U3H9_9PEZI|nr:hypothetical protein B0H63DRAFT_518884 [Podospora didyma]
MTRSRVARIFSDPTSAVTQKVRRVAKYLKRKTPRTLVPPDRGPSIPTLPNRVLPSPQPSTEHPGSRLEPPDADPAAIELSVDFSYKRRGSDLFRIQVHDSHQNPSADAYTADSSGCHMFDDLTARKCPLNCDCRVVGRSHVFTAKIYPSSVFVEILSSELSETLDRVIGLENLTSTDSPHNPNHVDGFALLRHYKSLQRFLDACSETRCEKLRLLVDGFLKVGEIWARHGWARLSESGVIDDDLLKKFCRQRLVGDILKLDHGFRSADMIAPTDDDYYRYEPTDNNHFEFELTDNNHFESEPTGNDYFEDELADDFFEPSGDIWLSELLSRHPFSEHLS